MLRSAAVLAAAGAVALAAMARSGGDQGFPTHPAAVAALVAGGLALSLARSRPRSSSRPGSRSEALVRGTGGLLLLYALLGSAAAAAAGADHAAAGLLAVLWGAAWLPPLVTTSAAAAAAWWPQRRWWAALLTVGGTVTAATAVLQEPVAPFAGLPTAVPGAWTTHGGPVLDVLSAVLGGALLAVPAALALRAALPTATATATATGARTAQRARAVVLALAGAAPVGVVLVCLLLAAARDPGELDPSVGSTGFLVVLALGCAGGCAAVRAAADDDPRRPALVAARCAAGAVVVLAVLAVGVVAASLLDGAPLLLVVGAVGALAAGGLEVWRRVSGWAAALLEEVTPAPAMAPARVAAPVAARVASPVRAVAAVDVPPRPAGWSELTAREREVLAELAGGASNAGIAAALGISPRTVEAHLRSVFTRLGLDPADGSNRRVVSARLWLEHGSPPPRGV